MHILHALIAMTLALLPGAGEDPDGNPLIEDPSWFVCEQPDEPNCGAPNGAGDWMPEPDPEQAPPATPAPTTPTFTG